MADHSRSLTNQGQRRLSPNVPSETIAEIRARAEQARRLSKAIHNRQAQIDLQNIAKDLEAEADEMETVHRGEDRESI